MTAPHETPDATKFELTITASGVVDQGTTNEGEAQ